MYNKKVSRMYILSFIFTLHIAISAYINSTFLADIISEKYVGVLYTISSIITLLLLTKSTLFLKNFGNRKFTIVLLFLNILSLIGLITSINTLIVAISFIIFTSTNTQILLCIDVFIEHFSMNKNVGKIRGLYLMIISLAWMLSPLLSSLLITNQGGYKAIYGVSLIAVILMTFGLVFSIRKFKDKTYKKTPFLETYKYLKTNKHMRSITVINFLLQFFYAWMVIYTTIYLHSHIGLDWEQIGIIYTVMLSPFVLLSYPIGVIIDQLNISKKTLLYIGFSIIIFTTSSIFFIDTRSIITWMIILFITRVGASIIETTSEIYFFDHIKEEEAYLIGVFRDMNPVAYIIAPVIGTLILSILPFKSIFVILGLILIGGFYYIPQLKNKNGIPNTNQ